jgi:hypothetical protein
MSALASMAKTSAIAPNFLGFVFDVRFFIISLLKVSARKRAPADIIAPNCRANLTQDLLIEAIIVRFGRRHCGTSLRHSLRRDRNRPHRKRYYIIKSDGGTSFFSFFSQVGGNFFIPVFIDIVAYFNL